MIYASRQLRGGYYHIFKLIYYDGIFIWQLHDLNAEPSSILKLPPDRRIKYDPGFFYLDFFESDLDGD